LALSGQSLLRNILSAIGAQRISRRLAAFVRIIR